LVSSSLPGTACRCLPATVGPVTSEYRSMRAQLAAPVEDLVARIRNPLMQIEFLSLLYDAKLLEPVLVGAETATRMVRPYRWFLDRVGTQGLKLTSAGYLPPADVEAASAELGLADEWYGKFNREAQTLPVLELRESAMRLGLLRRYRGMLVATPRGRELRGDPAGLWWHLARQLPYPKLPRPETHASILLLAAVAMGPKAAPDPLEYVARMMWEAGWQGSDDTPLTKWDARDAALDTHIALIRLGALSRNWHKLQDPERPTRDGALFARAALRTWPA
jgi:hypothetical protein